MKILCVAGARPNFVKIAPVLAALEAHGAAVELVHTGQHYDQKMSQVFFDELGVRTPDHHLGVGSGSHAQQTAAVMTAFEPIVTEVEPRAVVVVGDVNSTVAAALVAAKAGALVCHVEAGLRSRDWDMPEEVNRVVTDRLSDVLLAPSADAVETLKAEGYRDDQIHLVGNVMIDTLLSNLDRARERRFAERNGIDRPYGVVTLHRPSNVDVEDTFRGLMQAISTIAEDLPLVFPAHPRTRTLLAEMTNEPWGRALGTNLHLVEPLGYLDFLGLQQGAQLVLTDSGGIQEETTVLGIPCLTLRESTERPITVTEGTNTVVGTDPDAIIAAANVALGRQYQPMQPEGWDGQAGDRCARAILAAINDDRGLRPTSVVPPNPC